MLLPMRRWFINWIEKYRAAAWVTWAVVVFILHAFPGEYVPNYSWMELFAIDKWVHALMFGLGAYIIQFSVRTKLQTAILALGYAFMLELYQLLLASGRSFDWLDLLADTVGILLAFLV